MIPVLCKIKSSKIKLIVIYLLTGNFMSSLVSLYVKVFLLHTIIQI